MSGVPPLDELTAAAVSLTDRRLTMSQLGERVVLSRTRASRVVDELAVAGLVTRELNAADGRSSYAVLTAQGLAERVCPVLARRSVHAGTAPGLRYRARSPPGMTPAIPTFRDTKAPQMREDAQVDLTRAVQHIARGATDLDDARRRVDDLLRRAVGYDIGSFATVDPATGLWTSCYVSGLDATGSAARERILYDLELSGDVNTFSELAHRRTPAATLHAATDGVLPQARRWEPLLELLGVVDETRAVLRCGQRTWGVLALYRTGSARVFSPAELTALTGVLPDLALLFRLMVLRLALAHPRQQQTPPGGFTVLPDGTLAGVSASARAWLDTLDDRGRVPAAIRSVAAAARARSSAAAVSLPSRRGGFVTLYGSPIEGSDGVAVIIEPGRAAVVGDVLAHAYGLTAREREVAAQVATGKSTREVARALDISPFTVTDHLRALYAKAGVASRGELVAALHQADEQPRSGAPEPGATWYLDHNVPASAARA